MMKGRPILGIISGFMFGLFGGLSLFLFGLIPLHSDLLWILPLVGIVLGLFLAAWAPFGKGPESAAETPQSAAENVAPAVDTSASEPVEDATPTSEPAEAAQAPDESDSPSGETVVDVDVFSKEEDSQ